MNGISVLTRGMLGVGMAILVCASAHAQGLAPDQFSGLSLWLRADMGIVQSGGAVSEWQDQSGNGNHVGQTSAAAQPLLIENAIGGKPAVVFDGTDDLLTNGVYVLPGPATYVIVERNLSTPNGGSFFSSEASSRNSGVIMWNNNGILERYSSVPYNSPTARLLTHWDPNGGSPAAEWYMNGVRTAGQAAPSGVHVPPFMIGRRANHGFSSGEIAEFIVYNRRLDPYEVNDIALYVRNRYGIEAGVVTSVTIRQSLGPQGTFTAATGDLAESATLTFTGTRNFSSHESKLISGSVYGGQDPGATAESLTPSPGDVLVMALDLTDAPLGYDLTSIHTLTGVGGGQGGRMDQTYTLAFSVVGSDDWINPVNVDLPTITGGTEMQVALTPLPGQTVILMNVDALRFTFGNTAGEAENMYREFDVQGLASRPPAGTLISIR